MSKPVWHRRELRDRNGKVLARVKPMRTGAVPWFSVTTADGSLVRDTLNATQARRLAERVGAELIAREPARYEPMFEPKPVAPALDLKTAAAQLAAKGPRLPAPKPVERIVPEELPFEVPGLEILGVTRAWDDFEEEQQQQQQADEQFAAEIAKELGE